MIDRYRLLLLTATLVLLSNAASVRAETELSDPRLVRPLPVHNMYPAMLRFFDPVPASALETNEKQVELGVVQHYSSIYQYDQLPEGQLLADMEIYTLELLGDIAVTDTLTLGVTLPWHYAWDGFMDGFLRDFHDALGFPNGGRELRPDDDYQWYYRDPDGTDVWRDEPGWEPGNAVLRLKQQIMHSDHDGLAVLAAMQLPTGSVTRGWSNGEPDVAAGLVYSRRGSAWFAHLEGWGIIPLKKADPGIEYNAYFRGSFALGRVLTRRISLLAQIQGGTSPYSSGIAELDNSPVQFSFGANWLVTPRSMLKFTFVENINQDTTPDFGFTVGFSYR